MDFKEIEKLASQGESEQVELKETTGQITEAGKTLCALLNKRGGVVLIGVKEKGKITGQQVSDKTQQDIAQLLNDITPSAPVDFGIGSIPNSDKKIIFLKTHFPIPPAVYHFRDKVYERVGSSTLSVKYERLKQLMIERAFDCSWDQLPAEGYKISDLDQDEIFRTVEDGIANGRLEETIVAKNDPVSILRGLDLLANGALTNAAVILFAKKMNDQYSHCEIKMARFKGNTKDIGFIDEKRVIGHAFHVLREAETFVRRHLNIAIEFSEQSFQRIETPQLPFLAIREALINSICHRDYINKGTSISLAIYNDRLEIWNLGELLSPLNIDDLKGKHDSVLRNKKIAHVFYVRKYIEKWGSGTTRILKLCKELGVPEPQYSQRTGGFSVIFGFRESFGAQVIETEKIKKIKLTSRQQEIIEILSAGERFRSKDILKNISDNPTDRMLRYDLSFLKDNGFIDSEGSTKTTLWFIKK